MSERRAERRGSVRVAAAYPVCLCARQGRILSRGRTANISESGVYIVVNRARGLSVSGEVFLRISVPDASSKPSRREQSRTVNYRCRVAHTENLGRFVGMGVEFVEKLP
jgi:hypothetical protein